MSRVATKGKGGKVPEATAGSARKGVASGPLRDLRVVVLAGMGPVPFVSMLLADMGAQVVRVLKPETRQQPTMGQIDGLRDQADVVNRGTQSVTVDLRDPDFVTQLLDVVAQADVFIEGYRPGVVERLGLGPEVAIKVNPRLIYARLSGWGQTGPMAQMAGHDINYLAQSGALSAMARRGEVPRPPVNLLGDYAGGGLMAAYGILSALYAASSGRGQVIDAAMVDGVALLTARLHGLRAAGLFNDEPGTNFIDSGAPFYEVYRCLDGRFLAVGALEASFYATFLDLLDIDTSSWPAQDDRERWEELRRLIGDVIATRTRDDWADVYAGTDACVAPVLTFDEAATSPHNVERALYTTHDGVLHPAPAPRLSRTPAEPIRPTGVHHNDLSALLGIWRDR